MSDPRAWAIRPKWHRFETVKSYALRQSHAVGIPFGDVERGLTTEARPYIYRVWMNPAEAARTVEAAGGRPPGHFLRLVQAAQPHPGQHYPARFLCRLCARGDVVEQVPHDRENWCLKHAGQMVWTGPGTRPETQLIQPYDRQLARAERKFRRLAAAGRASARLHARAWEMVRDDASLTQPSGWAAPIRDDYTAHELRGRADLYRLTVAVLEMLTNDALISTLARLEPERLRPAIRHALPDTGTSLAVLVERVVLWLRRYRREERPTRLLPLNVPTDLVDTASIVDTAAAYPLWIQRRPTAIAEWDWQRNGSERDPWDLAGTSVPAHWVCDRGHTWEQTPYVRASAGCAYCAGQGAWPGDTDLTTLFPEVASQWDRTPGVNAGDPSEVSPGSTRRVQWVCGLGHTWRASIQNRTRRGSGCPRCAGNVVNTGQTDLSTVRPDLAAEWDWAKNGTLTPDLVTAKSTRKVNWRGRCGHSWTAPVANRVVHDTGCPYCAGKLAVAGVSDLAFIRPDLAAQWHPENTARPDQVRPRSGKPVLWLCASGHVWEASPDSRSRANIGCPFCSGRYRVSHDTTLAEMRPDLVPEWDSSNAISPEDVVPHSHYLATWRCQLDHRWAKRVYLRTGARDSRCPTCATEGRSAQ